MRIIVRAAIAAIAVLAAGAAPGACSSSKTTSPPPTSTSSTAPASTTSLPASTTAAAPTSSTTSATATTTCQPSQLHIVKSGYQGAAGTIEMTFSLTNTSTVTCSMHGYPGMLLLNAAGHAQPTTVNRGGGLAFENVAETDVSLVPGLTAYFNLGYNDVVSQPTACSMASQVEITPPNDTSYAVVLVIPTITACANGTLHVSPVFTSMNSAATQTTAPS